MAVDAKDPVCRAVLVIVFAFLVVHERATDTLSVAEVTHALAVYLSVLIVCDRQQRVVVGPLVGLSVAQSVVMAVDCPDVVCLLFKVGLFSVLVAVGQHVTLDVIKLGVCFCGRNKAIHHLGCDAFARVTRRATGQGEREKGRSVGSKLNQVLPDLEGKLTGRHLLHLGSLAFHARQNK
jgi:hypothetical protein